MTTYARWPKSIWYVYDVRGHLHIMSIKHADDIPVVVAKSDIGSVDIEYVVTRFPDLEDAEVNELLGYVAAYAATEDAIAEPEAAVVPETISEAVPETSAPKKRARKSKKAADDKTVVEVKASVGVGNGDEFPSPTADDLRRLTETPVYENHVSVPVAARELPPLPELPADAVPVNIDLLPEW